MSAFSAFYDHLLPELPKCTTGNVDLQLVLLARDFCERSRVWRVDFTAVNLVADTAAYTLSIGVSATELVAVHKLTVNDVLLFDEYWDEERASRTDTSDSTADAPEYDRGDPPFQVSNDRTQITLIADETPTAAVVGGLEVSGSIKPTLAATTLPDFILSMHLEAMRAGVLSRLMAQANKPWSAPAQAAQYRIEYESRLLHAATNAQRGNVRTLLRSRKWG